MADELTGDGSCDPETNAAEKIEAAAKDFSEARAKELQDNADDTVLAREEAQIAERRGQIARDKVAQLEREAHDRQVIEEQERRLHPGSGGGACPDPTPAPRPPRPRVG